LHEEWLIQHKKFKLPAPVLRTTEWNETKHDMNVPYEVLTKCCYFVANPTSKMAASGGTKEPLNGLKPNIA
ncbi:hypothetical protein AM593_08146, partial [Mytilus galloprovincialis]